MQAYYQAAKDAEHRPTTDAEYLQDHTTRSGWGTDYRAQNMFDLGCCITSDCPAGVPSQRPGGQHYYVPAPNQAEQKLYAQG